MAHALRTLLVILGVAAGGWAQATTGLSSSWTLEQGSGSALVTARPATQTNGPPPPPHQLAIKISQTPTAFRIERTLGTENGATLQQVDSTLEGSETTIQMGPILSRTTAAWNGHSLVLSTVHSEAGNAVGPMAGRILGNLQETFMLQDGRLVVHGVRSFGRQSVNRDVRLHTLALVREGPAGRGWVVGRTSTAVLRPR